MTGISCILVIIFLQKEKKIQLILKFSVVSIRSSKETKFQDQSCVWINENSSVSGTALLFLSWL
jgi:hypothetical protein